MRTHRNKLMSLLKSCLDSWISNMMNLRAPRLNLNRQDFKRGTLPHWITLQMLCSCRPQHSHSILDRFQYFCSILIISTQRSSGITGYKPPAPLNPSSIFLQVFHCTGNMRPLGGSMSPPAARAMTLLCEPVPHPSSVEFPLDTCTFLTRHSMDLRFTHCEGR